MSRAREQAQPGRRGDEITAYLFRFRYEVRGGHTHVRLFAGKGSLSLALCGAVVFCNEEWDAFVAEVNRGKAGGDIEFVEEMS